MRKYFILLFILGVIFRLWFGNLVPQPFVFDQVEYHQMALNILGAVGFIPSLSARLYGYPLLLAIIYKIFGIGNLGAVAIIQALIDCLSGVLIYLTAKKIFKNQVIPVVSYILYLFNPITSVFVVLTLSEVWGIFLMILITYLLILVITDQKKYHFLSLGLLLGYLPQVRPAFLFYSLTLLGIIVIWSYKSYILRRSVLIAVLLFILPFTYNIAGNWKYFKQFSPTNVDNLLVREFYISLFVAGRSPFHAARSDDFPKEVQIIYNEYSSLPQNVRERKAMTLKYLNLALTKVTGNPSGFIFSRLSKFLYVWEKHFIFYYYQPENRLADFLTYWGNNLLIFIAVYSFYTWFHTEASRKLRWFGHLTIFTIFYISAVHSFSLAEERYSLPGYPLIFLFAGFGVWNIIRKVIKSLNN